MATMTQPGTQYRAVVDGVIRFGNGGSITVEGFRLDVAEPSPDREAVAQLLVRSLGLLMADEVDLSSLEVVEEPHKGTRGGPSDTAAGGSGTATRRLVELSHPIRAGMVTLPGLPGPEISLHLTREASTAKYAEGTTFEIGRISMVANTGTYVDAPLHRFARGRRPGRAAAGEARGSRGRGGPGCGVRGARDRRRDAAGS